MSKNLKTIELVYEAFGRADVKAILELMAENVAWDTHYGDSPIPYLKAGRGRSAVVHFFTSLNEALELKRFEVEAIIDGGPLVVALLNLDAVARATGKTFSERREVHVWELDEHGLIKDFQHGVDTLTHFRALQR
jgi:ketosteroid isomerase-like protein